MDAKPRILIVSEHASMAFGGEASLPWHYFVRLNARGYETWLVVHERTRAELQNIAPHLGQYIHYIPDSRLNELCWKAEQYLPHRLGLNSFGYFSRLATQLRARRLSRKLIRQHDIKILHQPIPVSPRETSLMNAMGVPVVIGPMNGNMTFPPGVKPQGSGNRLGAFAMRQGRRIADRMHVFMRGKREAALLLVANERTRQGLPAHCHGEVATLVENGIDTELWFPPRREREPGDPVRFVFLGRLVDWKAVDILLEATALLPKDESIQLDIIGDGPERESLEAMTRHLGLGDKVAFHGFLPQPDCAAMLRQADALVLPSLYECGGAAVLEAMATALPVIATAWGGPLDYLDESCGILVKPDSRRSLVTGFAEAMSTLVRDGDLRKRLGSAGRQRALRNFDWDDKIARMITYYQAVIAGRPVREEDAPNRTVERLMQHQFILRPDAAKSKS